MQLILAFLIGVAVASILAYFKIKSLTTQKQQALLENARLLERTSGQEQFVRQLLNEQDKKFLALQEAAKNTFKQLATDSLKTQKEDLISKSNDLFTPLKDTMDRFAKEMGTLRTETAQRHGSLQTALDQTKALNEKLSKQANDLSTALKNPKTQGTWGEIILEDVLRSMGLREGIEFEKQASFKTEQGQRQQPDFIVHLPQQRDLIIDSKMSLNSYTKWANATDENEKQKLLKEHTRAVEEHIKELSAKDYPKLLKNEKLDFTLMFIPIEYAYFAALQENPSLNELAHKHHIYIVTASNLLTVLQIAENLWRAEHSTKMVNQIFKIAQDMHERVGRFAQRMEDLDAKIAGVRKSYDNASKTLTGPQSIVTSAKQLEQLRIKSAHTLPKVSDEESPALFMDNTPAK